MNLKLYEPDVITKCQFSLRLVKDDRVGYVRNIVTQNAYDFITALRVIMFNIYPDKPDSYVVLLLNSLIERKSRQILLRHNNVTIELNYYMPPSVKTDRNDYMNLIHSVITMFSDYQRDPIHDEMFYSFKELALAEELEKDKDYDNLNICKKGF